MMPPRLRSIVFFGSAALALAAGCGDDDEEAPPVTPREPPSVTILSISSSSGHVFDPDAGAGYVETGCDPGQSVSVRFAHPQFDLRPPGFCSGASQCGTVRVSAAGPGGEISERSSAEAPALQFADLAFVPGEYVFRVELLDDAGQKLTIGDPEDQVTVEVRRPVGCGPDAGPDTGVPDAGPDAPPDAGPDVAPDAGPDARDAAPDQAPGDAPADAPLDGADAADQG